MKYLGIITKVGLAILALVLACVPAAHADVNTVVSSSSTSKATETKKKAKKKTKKKTKKKARKKTKKKKKNANLKKTHRDKKGGVQQGIQSLAVRLVDGLKSAEDIGFRRMAVLPFKTEDPAVERHRLGRISSELLSSRLAQSPRIIQVERDRLDAVIGELKRSEKGQLSKDGAISVGKLLGANNVVVGSVTTVGADYLVTARVVDSETGRVVTAADQSFPKAGLVALSEDVVEVKSRMGAAIRSAVFPGWGQIYNGDTGRGIVYSAAFLGTAAGAITSMILGSQAENEYNRNERGTVDERDAANGHYNRTNYFLIGLGGIWALATVDAYLTGKDATTINLDLAPTATGAAGQISVKGHF